MSEKSFLTELLPWAPLIGTLGGVLLTGLISLGITRINKKSEERRHFQDLMFKSAVEEWKQHCTMAIETMKIGKKTAIAPLVTYLVHLIKLSEMLLDGKITKESLSKKFAEIEEVMNELKKFTAPPKKENE